MERLLPVGDEVQDQARYDDVGAPGIDRQRLCVTRLERCPAISHVSSCLGEKALRAIHGKQALRIAG
jgi:hypothetical protein